MPLNPTDLADVDQSTRDLLIQMQKEIDATSASGVDLALVHAQANFYEALNAQVGAKDAAENIAMFDALATAVLGL